MSNKMNLKYPEESLTRAKHRSRKIQPQLATTLVLRIGAESNKRCYSETDRNSSMITIIYLSLFSGNKK